MAGGRIVFSSIGSTFSKDNGKSSTVKMYMWCINKGKWSWSVLLMVTDPAGMYHNAQAHIEHPLWRAEHHFDFHGSRWFRVMYWPWRRTSHYTRIFNSSKRSGFHLLSQMHENGCLLWTRRGMHLVPYSIAVQCWCWYHYMGIGINLGINFLFLNYLYSFIFLQSGNDADSD